MLKPEFYYSIPKEQLSDHRNLCSANYTVLHRYF